MVERIITWLEGLRTKRHQYNQKKQIARIREEVKTIFNVYEHHGEIWLSYKDDLICPMSMFKDDPMTVLKKIRDWYVEDEVQEESN